MANPSIDSDWLDTSNQYIKYYIHAEETAVDDAANTSTLTVSVYAWRSNDYRTDKSGTCYIKIGDYVDGNSWSVGQKPIVHGSYTLLHSVSGYVYHHNSDGTATANIQAKIELTGSATSNYQGVNFGLTSTDTKPATLSIDVTNITHNGFTISSSASASCSHWWYNIGAGWILVSGASGTSMTQNVTGLSPNVTYQVQVSAKKASNGVDGYSETKSIKTVGNSTLRGFGSLISGYQNGLVVDKYDGGYINIPIYTTVNVSSYSHKITIKNKNNTDLYKDIKFERNVLINGANIYRLSSSDSPFLNWIPSTDRAIECVVELRTFDSSASGQTAQNQIGDVSILNGVLTTTNDGSGPTFTYAACDDENGTTKNVLNATVYLQGTSIIRASADFGTAKNGATLTKYIAEVDGLSRTTEVRLNGSTRQYKDTDGTWTNCTYSSGKYLVPIKNIGSPKTTGDVTCTITAVDSRGWTASKTVTINVAKYEYPKISSMSVRRINEVEETIQFVLKGSITSVKVNNVEKNTVLKGWYRYKQTSSETWSSWIPANTGAKLNPTISGDYTRIQLSGTSFNASSDNYLTLDGESSYNFEIDLEDTFGDASLRYTRQMAVISKSIPLMSFRSKKVGINNPNPDKALDVIGDLRVAGVMTSKYKTSVTPGILYEGSRGVTDSVIRFIDNSTDNSGSGVSVGGGGLSALIGGDCSVGVVAQYSYPGEEYVAIGSDNDIDFYTNCVMNNAGTALQSYTKTSIQGDLFTGRCSSAETATKSSGLIDSTYSDWQFKCEYNTEIKRNNASWLAVWNSDSGSKTYGLRSLNIDRLSSCTRVFSGSLTSGSTSFAYKNNNGEIFYNYYIIIGVEGSGAGSDHKCLIIPREAVSGQFFELSGYFGWYQFKISHSGNNCVVAFNSRKDNGGYIDAIYAGN